MSLADLPEDVLALIAARTRTRDRLALSATCRRLHEVSRSPSWWADDRMRVRLCTEAGMHSFWMWLLDRAMNTRHLHIHLRGGCDRNVWQVGLLVKTASQAARRLDTLVLRVYETATIDLRCVGGGGGVRVIGGRVPDTA